MSAGEYRPGSRPEGVGQPVGEVGPVYTSERARELLEWFRGFSLPLGTAPRQVNLHDDPPPLGWQGFRADLEIWDEVPGE